MHMESAVFKPLPSYNILIKTKLMPLGLTNRIVNNSDYQAGQFRSSILIIDFSPIRNPTSNSSGQLWFRSKFDLFWLKDRFKDWKIGLKIEKFD